MEGGGAVAEKPCLACLSRDVSALHRVLPTGAVVPAMTQCDILGV